MSNENDGFFDGNNPYHVCRFEFKNDLKKVKEDLSKIGILEVTDSNRIALRTQRKQALREASLRREINAGVLQEIQLAMLNSGAQYKLEEAKADLKS